MRLLKLIRFDSLCCFSALHLAVKMGAAKKLHQPLKAL